MSSASHASSTLPSIGKPMSGWRSSPITGSSSGSLRSRRQQKLGLWSAVALQQHFTFTGGRRGAPLPSSETPSPSLGVDSADGRGSSHGTLNANGDYAPAREDLRSHLGPSGGLPGHPHKPTLAQRMGLVPAPPPAPTAEDWRAVVQRAMLREQQAGGTSSSSSSHYHDNHSGYWSTGCAVSGTSACSICQMSFLSTSEEGQVILSCSHVFHSQCFRAFERCVRAQQRADGAGIAEMTAQLACPVCRTQHYYKRVFYEGKAMTQRAAIVKVQSAIRGHLARRAYVQLRLQSNPQFRTRYVQERLARLSAAWTAFCAQQERQRENTLVALAVQHQAATAAYLTEEDWRTIWRRVRMALVEADTEGLEVGQAVAAALTCPICLERIHESFFSQQHQQQQQQDAAKVLLGKGRADDEALTTRATGDDAVAALRRDYEDRRRQRAVEPVEVKNGGKTEKMRKSLVSLNKTAPKHTSQKPKKVSKSSGSVTTVNASSTAASPQPLPPLPTPPPASSSSLARHAYGPRSGVLLSCGHFFHTACIGCYERFNELRLTDVREGNVAASSASGAVIADRCPICRAGYAKHPL